MENQDMNFVEKRLREQAGEQAKDELYNFVAQMSNSFYAKELYQKTRQIMNWEEDPKYKMSCQFYYVGDSEELKTKIKDALDKRANEIYQELADDLLHKLSNLDYLFNQ